MRRLARFVTVTLGTALPVAALMGWLFPGYSAALVFIGLNLGVVVASGSELVRMSRSPAGSSPSVRALVAGGCTLLIVGTTLIGGSTLGVQAELRLVVQLLVLSTGFAGLLTGWYGSTVLRQHHVGSVEE